MSSKHTHMRLAWHCPVTGLLHAHCSSQGPGSAFALQVSASGVAGTGTLSAATPVCTSALYILNAVLLPAKTLATVPIATAAAAGVCLHSVLMPAGLTGMHAQC